MDEKYKIIEMPEMPDNPYISEAIRSELSRATIKLGNKMYDDFYFQGEEMPKSMSQQEFTKLLNRRYITISDYLSDNSIIVNLDDISYVKCIGNVKVKDGNKDDTFALEQVLEISFKNKEKIVFKMDGLSNNNLIQLLNKDETIKESILYALCH